jgi:hypothetical protein
METLNYAISQLVLNADGRYLDDQEISVLEQYASNHARRLDAYQQLREKGDMLITIALRKLAQSQPELVQRNGTKCKQDMGHVVRYVALAILRDDEVFFKERILIWLDTILLAHKHNGHAARAYQHLLGVMTANLSEASMRLIRPYVELIVETFQAHV